MLNETLLAKASNFKYFLATRDGQFKGTKRTFKFQEVILLNLLYLLNKEDFSVTNCKFSSCDYYFKFEKFKRRYVIKKFSQFCTFLITLASNEPPNTGEDIPCRLKILYFFH